MSPITIAELKAMQTKLRLLAEIAESRRVTGQNVKTRLRLAQVRDAHTAHAEDYDSLIKFAEGQ